MNIAKIIDQTNIRPEATLKDVKMMLNAGADIIGTSSGVEIIKEFNA